MKAKVLLLFSFSLFLAFCAYSYTQTDPNLVLLQNGYYQAFQESMWNIGYHQRQISTIIYTIIICLFFLSYAFFLRQKKKIKVWLLIGVSLILFFSFPTLSHDVFNYIFNAKMVVVYQANPHIHTALEFSQDLWTRFMHNTHTAAPYGYGWTALSLIPFVAGIQKFILTLFAFRVWMYVGLFVLMFIQYRLARLLKDEDWKKNVWVFILNPLVLVETLNTLHNDVWMMVFAYTSLYFVWKMTLEKKKTVHLLVLGILSFIASYSIKFSTVALLPIFSLIVLPKKYSKGILVSLKKHWAELSSMVMFLPLLIERSQQFHPWYLIWSLSFISFIKNTYIRMFLIAFSFSSLLRYIPYLSQGDFSGNVLLHQKMITWIGGVTVFLLMTVLFRLQQTQKGRAMLQ